MNATANIQIPFQDNSWLGGLFCLDFFTTLLYATIGQYISHRIQIKPTWTSPTWSIILVMNHKHQKWYYPAKGRALSSSWQPPEPDHHEKLSRNSSRAAELFRTLRRRKTGPYDGTTLVIHSKGKFQHNTRKNGLQPPSSVLENSGPQGKIWGLIIMAAHLLKASTRNIIFITNHKNQNRCHPAIGRSLSSSWQPTEPDHHEKLSRNK